MKIENYLSIEYFILILAILTFPSAAFGNASLPDRLSGRILLQVEDKGKAWYVNPENKKRYYLGRPSDAFSVMREMGLGVSNKDFDGFKGYAPARLSGKILLKAEDKGKAYYVNPLDLKMHYLGRPADAFDLMRKLGLGISDDDLEQIGSGDGASSAKTEITGEEKIVTKVVDGDTVVVSGGDHVRLLGIDTDEKNFPCFTPAKNYLEDLVLGKTVVLEQDKEDKDQYDRLLRFLFLDGLNVNLKIVEEGLAVCRYYEPNSKYKRECAKLETDAIKNKTGCKWSDGNWTSPDDTSLIPTAAPSTTSGSCLIKGNISYTTKEKIYHVPGCENYTVTKIDESAGERWFCNENEAVEAGWRKATNCN